MTHAYYYHKRLKYVGLGVFSFLFLLLILPPCINWTFLKKDIEAFLSTELQTEVTCQTIHVSALPFPMILLTNIHIHEKKEQNQPILHATLDEAKATLSVFDLLFLKITTTLRLKNPTVLLAQSFIDSHKKTVQNAPHNVSPKAVTLRDFQCNFFIEEGKITYIKETHQIHINNRFIQGKAQPFSQKYEVSADVVYRHTPLSAHATLDASQLACTVTYDEKLSCTFDGELDLQKFNVQGKIKSHLKGVSFVDTPLLFEGELHASSKKIELSLAEQKRNTRIKATLILDPLVHGSLFVDRLPGQGTLSLTLDNKGQGHFAIDDLASLFPQIEKFVQKKTKY